MKLVKNTAHDGILSLKLVLPIGEDADLLLGEAVEGRGDVFVVLAHLGECPAGIFSGEHGVGAAGAVEGLSGGDVEDSALYGDVYGLGWVCTVVLA